MISNYRRQAVLTFLLCLLGSASWLVAGQEKRLPPTAQPPAPSPQAAAGVGFSEVTQAAGLGGFTFTAGSPKKDYLIETTGAGVGFIDYDNDGWQDIYLVNGGTIDVLRGKARAPRAALYKNNRDGTFTDVTEKAGVANERWGQGLAIGDFDNDGWEDLYVTNYGKNRLYRNNRNGTFTDIAEKAGVACGGWSTGVAFGDYDGDGLLDLYVAGYVDLDVNNLPPPASGETARATAKAGEEEAADKGMGATYKVGMNYCQYRGQRVMCGPRGLKGAPDFLFRNNGDGTFTDTTQKAGVADQSLYYGFAVIWFDMDDDGRQDLLVANDSTPNYMYRNKGDGTFEDLSYTSGLALNENGREQASMGTAVGDYNGDGRNDVFMTNFADDSNVLYHNDDGLNFTEYTFQMGLGEISIPFLGWGTNFLDYDNDGQLDLLVANGHVYPSVDSADMGTSYKQRLLLFRQTGKKFHEVGSSAGQALNVPRATRGSAVADYDNDGDLDILLGNLDGPATLLRNDGANKAGHWLKVRLLGDPTQKGPKDAIGSVAFCHVNGRRIRDEVASGRSYHSQSDLRLHFGLGTATKVERLEVRWANGRTESFTIEGVDKLVVIQQGRGKVAAF